MSDRELLEKAAKAVGLHFHGHRETKTIAAAWVSTTGNTDDWFCWNPLTDDGDALRLAVKLKIEVYQGDNDGPCASAGYFSGNANTQRQRFMIERHSDSDPYAATRRAVVRAAAAIGGAQ